MPHIGTTELIILLSAVLIMFIPAWVWAGRILVRKGYTLWLLLGLTLLFGGTPLVLITALLLPDQRTGSRTH